MKKYNILMVMADQWRSEWIGIAGTNLVYTPNIDAIAQRGVRFARAICNAPSCAPSRIALASGIYGNRLGAYDNDAFYPAVSSGFSFMQPTYYKALEEAGYRVGVVGKVDLRKGGDMNFTIDGKSGFPLMRELGFTDSWVTTGKRSAGSFAKLFFEDKTIVKNYSDDYDRRKNQLPAWYSGSVPVPSEFYQDNHIGRKAVELLNQFEDETPDKPWHLFVSFVGPHAPWDAPEEYFKIYSDKQYLPSIHSYFYGKPEGVQKQAQRQSDEMKPEHLNKVKQHYAGMITLIDDWVGKMLEVLKKRGLLLNTIIIFTSDHGEMMGDFGLFAKSQMYEGALRVPLIITHPDMKVRGESNVLAELVDIYPTILDMAGIAYDSSNLDGKSLMLVLEGKSNIHKEYQYCEIGAKIEWPYAQKRMVFDGRYKYIESNKFRELYDLVEDPLELINIVTKQPEIATRLADIMAGFSAKAIAPQIVKQKINCN